MQNDVLSAKDTVTGGTTVEWNRSTKILTAILLSGLAVRLVLSPFFADYNDFSYWTGTAFDVMNGNGIYRGYDFWYPPVWGYVISFLTPLMDLFGCTPMDTVVDKATSHGYWVGDGFISDPLTVFIIKLPLILSDTACGYLVYSITRRITSDERKSLIASAFWTLCPLTIYVSAVQGQFETIEALFLLLALWAYLKGSYAETGAFIAASILTKPFTVLVLLPLMALIWVKGQDTNQRLKYTGMYIAGGLAMAVFLVLPQLINGEMEYLFGFLSDRSSMGYPLPSEFAMSVTDMSFADQSIGDVLYPSANKVSSTIPLAAILSVVLAVFILIKKNISDVSAVLIVSAATCLHLIWYPAAGYIQYYVPVIAVLAICTSLDRRFAYAGAAVTVFGLISAFWGFRHAYQLCLLGWVDVDALNSVFSGMRAIMDYPDLVATHLKFLPVLVAVVLSLIIVRRSDDEA